MNVAISITCEVCGINALPPCPVCKASKVEPNVGTALKSFIPKTFQKKGCGCNEYAMQMDRWGIEGCLDRREEIVDHLINQAHKTFAGSFSDSANRKIASWWLDRAITKAIRQACGDPIHTENDSSWCAVVTTAPRQAPTLHQTIKSLRAAGWEPIVCAEPGSLPTNCTTIENRLRKGVWHNWLSACRYAVESGSKYILTVQDDIEIHPDTKAFVNDINRFGFLSLYTPKHYSEGRDVGINRIATKSLWGACAIVWRRDLLERVISHKLASEWRGASLKTKAAQAKVFANRAANPHLIANSDTAIGKIMNRLDEPMYFVDPSPASHIAKMSAIGHGGNQGRRNCSRCSDHNQPLEAQVWPKGRPDGYPKDTGNERYDRLAREWFDRGNSLTMIVHASLWEAIKAEVRSDDDTLEFGSGISTAAFAKARSHTAIEQDAEHAAATGAVHAPIENGWYQWEPKRTYRVILVDGPADGQRYHGLGTILKAAQSDTVFFVDDTHRTQEARLAIEISDRTGKQMSITTEGNRQWVRIG